MTITTKNFTAVAASTRRRRFKMLAMADDGTTTAAEEAAAAGGDSPAYPSDWAWSANFAPSLSIDADAVATEVNIHAYNMSGITVSSSIGKGVMSWFNFAKGTIIYAGGFSPGNLPAAAVSGTLQDGATDPNGGTIDLALAKYLTVYFQIDTLATQPPTALGEEMYWSGTSAADYNTTPISPLNIVRKTGGHDGELTSGTYESGEYISVSYDMTSQNSDAGDDWDNDSGIIIHSLGGSIVGSAWYNTKIIHHGYVVSNLYNNSPAISNINLPIVVE